MPTIKEELPELLQRIQGCKICADLPLGPKPILQVDRDAGILIVGQAPGSKTHAKGVPFDDPSGDRLRDWMGIDRETFYNSSKIAVLPMGFCFPGTGTSGDLPPRTECAEKWRRRVLNHMQDVELVIIIGRYAIDWHLPEYSSKTVTSAVQGWKDLLPSSLILPHPSPRNNRWLKTNLWFEVDILPEPTFDECRLCLLSHCKPEVLKSISQS